MLVAKALRPTAAAAGREPHDSIALQYAVPLETISRAPRRASCGKASGPLGGAFDLLAVEESAP